MFCQNCGTANADDGRFCVNCGVPLAPAAPVGHQTVDQKAIASPIPQESSGKALASLICGIFFFVFPSAIAAIILGHLSLSEIRKSAGRLGGQGIAIAGLVLGYLGVAVIPFVLIVAAIAIPNLLRARMAANEASAVGALRRINESESWYASKYKNGFSASLDALAKRDDDQELNCDHAGVISSNLANGTIYGYAFTYVPLTAEGKTPIGRTARSPNSQCSEAGAPRYELTADPVQRGVTGQRSFYTDETGVIRYEIGDAAGAKSPPLQ